ncbi:hypothetical protein E1B28_003752 [Marasmius oreades]|uniref:Uncharacterized protein n=1 Tax=Marasmius oreades TaxID=181124 RepID=A0A9P7UX40_9AGAR|nr:uncharacterized protein E1B28_003752 [Marasmius oreades]KAG7096306.1 hypothetical protein E1B28_003752 [Marasmius oreades]
MCWTPNPLPCCSSHHPPSVRPLSTAKVRTMKNFQAASGISMQTAIFNDIGGNQITNHYTIREERERNIYDEFRSIRLGDVEMIRELGDVTFRKFNGFRGDVVMSTFTAVVHSGQGSKCTVLSYSGPDAEEEWERDFRQVSGLRCVNTPGISPTGESLY